MQLALIQRIQLKSGKPQLTSFNAPRGLTNLRANENYFLYMRLDEGGLMQDHIKSMTKLCNELSGLCDPVNEEDFVVYFLASPELGNLNRAK